MIGFETPELMLMAVLLVPLIFRALKFRPLQRVVGLLTIVAAFSIIVAASGPFITAQESEEGVKELVVVEDQSMSSQLIDKEEIASDEVILDRRTVNSDRESFDRQVDNILEPNETYLFVSDLQADTSELEQSFREKNASVNILREEMDEEHSVVIDGPDEAVMGAENSYTARVSSTNGSTSMTVGHDDDIIYSGDDQEHEFELSFEEEGYEQLWVEIEADDIYDENNEYFKTVEVRDKPELLVLGEEGSLETELEDFYEVEYASSIPQNVDDFDTVLTKESTDSQELRDYLIEGGGLVYTGDDYDPDYLPVQSADTDDETDAPLIVLVVDVSHSTGCVADDSGEDQSIYTGCDRSDVVPTSVLYANEIVENLPENTRVSIVPYARTDYNRELNQPRVLSAEGDEIREDLSRIRAQNDPTYQESGIQRANSILRSESVDGNAIMITNGRPAERVYDQSRRAATQEANRFSGRLITVGIDEELAPPEDSDRDFLQDIAERTDQGYYLDAYSIDDLEFAFEAGGGEGEMSPLTVTDSTHFITRDTNLDASIIEIDGAESKSSANTLVETVDGQPFLTTWRYGTGRVAAFTGDNQDLEEVMEQEPGIPGRTFSWTTGPMDQDKWVEGDTVEDDFRIYSREQEEGFRRQSEERYYRDLEHNETGFYEDSGVEYSVNYMPQLQQLGYNEDAVSDFTVGGQVYEPHQLESLYDQLEMSERTSDDTTDLRPYALIVGLLFYLSAVGIRKKKGLA